MCLELIALWLGESFRVALGLSLSVSGRAAPSLLAHLGWTHPPVALSPVICLRDLITPVLHSH